MENNRQVVVQFKRIDFYGGEPWLIQEHWDTLSKMVELGYSKDCILHYTTNGTVFKSKQVDLLKQTKTVSIQLSIDGIGNRFEYQRYPGKWSVIENNIKRFCSCVNTVSLSVPVQH